MCTRELWIWPITPYFSCGNAECIALEIANFKKLIATVVIHFTVITYCQSFISKLQQGSVLRRNTTSPGFPVLQECHRLISPKRPPGTAPHNPVRLVPPPVGQLHRGPLRWHTLSPSSTSVPLLNGSFYQAILQAAIHGLALHSQAPHPMMASPQTAIQGATLSYYLNFRDDRTTSTSVMTREQSADTSVLFTAHAWSLRARRIGKRGSKIRHLWDLRWHGENQAIAQPGLKADLTSSPLCGHPRWSQTQIICECPRLTHERAGLHLDLTVLISRHPRGPRRSLGREYQRLLFHRPAATSGRSNGPMRSAPSSNPTSGQDNGRSSAHGSRNSESNTIPVHKRQPPCPPLRVPPLLPRRPALAHLILCFFGVAHRQFSPLESPACLPNVRQVLRCSARLTPSNGTLRPHGFS